MCYCWCLCVCQDHRGGTASAGGGVQCSAGVGTITITRRVFINRIKMTFHPFSSAHLDFYFVPFIIWRPSSVRFTSETLQLLTNGARMDHINLFQTNCQVSKSWSRAGEVSVLEEWKQQETIWTDSLVWSWEEFNATEGVLTAAFLHPLTHLLSLLQ